MQTFEPSLIYVNQPLCMRLARVWLANRKQATKKPKNSDAVCESSWITINYGVLFIKLCHIFSDQAPTTLATPIPPHPPRLYVSTMVFEIVYTADTISIFLCKFVWGFCRWGNIFGMDWTVSIKWAEVDRIEPASQAKENHPIVRQRWFACSAMDLWKNEVLDLPSNEDTAAKNLSCHFILMTGA